MNFLDTAPFIKYRSLISKMFVNEFASEITQNLAQKTTVESHN